MNYSRIYFELIQNAKQRFTLTGYTEKHHIVPKSLGGSDFSDNLVRLTAREHYIAHLLLAHIYGGMQWCPVMMFKNKGAVKSSRMYEMARKQSNLALKSVTDEEIIASAQPFTKPSIWKKNYPSYYVLARQRGLLNRCTEHMLEKRLMNQFTTKEQVIQALRRSDCRRHFQKAFRGAYNLVCKNNWWYLVDEVHPLKIIHGQWTKKACAKEAKKYFRRVDFQRGSPSAYVIARKNGWLDDICQHMISKRTQWDMVNIRQTIEDYQMSSIADIRRKLPKLHLWLYRHATFLNQVKSEFNFQ